MSSDPYNQAGGLFGNRFRRPGGAESWSMADIGIVDADLVAPPTARESPPVPPVWEMPPEDEDTAGPSLPSFTSAPPSAPPERHAQALWEVAPSRSSQQVTLGTLGQHLAAALYPHQPEISRWRRLFGLGAGQKSKLPEIISLELIGSSLGARFFLRGSLPVVTRVFDRLLASYGSVEREEHKPDVYMGSDPLIPQQGEGAGFAELFLARPAALPLKVPGPASIADGFDPLAAVLQTCTGSLGQAHGGLRLASQLLITQAPAHWSERYQSLLQEQQAQQAASSSAKADDMQQAGMTVLFLTGVVSAVLVIHGLLPLLLALLPGVLLVGGFLLSSMLQRGVLVWRLTRSRQEVTNKLSQTVVRACLRLYVVGPINEPQACEQALDRLIAAYGVYKGANSWKVGRRGKFGAKPLAVQPVSRWTRLMIWAGGDQTRPVLGMNEVTALWHLRPSDTILKDSNAYQKSGFPGAPEQF